MDPASIPSKDREINRGPASCNCFGRPIESDLRRKEGVATSADEQDPSDRGLPESGILQSTGHAANHLRQTTGHVIGCGEDLGKHLALPRGCLDDLVALLEALKIKPVVRDERFAGRPIDATFHGVLRDKQQEAVDAITRHDNGFLCAPTAFGKTAVSAWLIANRGVNALVLVHRQQLLDQWRERLAMFLNLPIDEIGQVGAGKTKRTGKIDVAVIQSLYRKDEVKDFVADYGHIIVDECHHLSAFTFEKVMRQAKAKYVIGLTATPTRKDGHHPIMYMQCGPARFSMSARAMTDTTPFDHIVIPRVTDFRMLNDGSNIAIQDVYAASSPIVLAMNSSVRI